MEDRDEFLDWMFTRVGARPYFCVQQKCYKLGRWALKGVNKLLAEWYYSEQAREERKNLGGTHRGCMVGRRVDREISEWANKRAGKEYLIHPPRELHPYTIKLIKAFHIWGFRPLKAQFVVGTFALGGCGTGLDIVMRNAKGELVIVEVKCGKWLCGRRRGVRKEEN